ncbi:hypothetical protein [Brasilonema bromeliae]|uniref:hypothetical protein n=1 Tax=Brasilonema bromeliae TaxID=383615 RepID=UPI00145C413C
MEKWAAMEMTSKYNLGGLTRLKPALVYEHYCDRLHKPGCPSGRGEVIRINATRVL